VKKVEKYQRLVVKKEVNLTKYLPPSPIGGEERANILLSQRSYREKERGGIH